MEIDIELYSSSNKENGLRKRASAASAASTSTNRPCLLDITHKFVEKKENVGVCKNVGLFNLAMGNRIGNGSIKRCLPR